MTSSEWIEVAQLADEKIIQLPSIQTHEYEWQIYSVAKANALLHATSCYAVLPEEYEQACKLAID